MNGVIDIVLPQLGFDDLEVWPVQIEFIPEGQAGRDGINLPPPGVPNGWAATAHDGEIVYVETATLAQAGQTPPEEPVAGQDEAGVGTSTAAARADHVHPNGLTPATRSGFLTGRPAGRGVDLHLTGANKGYAVGTYGDFGVLGNYGFVGESSPYTGGFLAPFDVSLPIYLGDLTLDAGAVIQEAVRGRGLCIVCTGTLTVNGTIQTRGESPAVGVDPAQPHDWTCGTGWSGWGGAAATTGAGAAAEVPGNQTSVLGGGGGNGGASGASAGGAGSCNPGPPSNAVVGPSFEDLIYLRNHPSISIASISGTSSGGVGGGSGAGDGSHKGGAGGGGAGHLILIAPRVIIGSTAVIRSVGGNGAAGNGGNAAGGGGGGAGIVAIHAMDLSIDPAATVAAIAGAGGLGSGSGANGTAGLASSRILDPAAGYGGHGYGAGVLICDWS